MLLEEKQLQALRDLMPAAPTLPPLPATAAAAAHSRSESVEGLLGEAALGGGDMLRRSVEVWGLQQAGSGGSSSGAPPGNRGEPSSAPWGSATSASAAAVVASGPFAVPAQVRAHKGRGMAGGVGGAMYRCMVLAVPAQLLGVAGLSPYLVHTLSAAAACGFQTLAVFHTYLYFTLTPPLS